MAPINLAQGDDGPGADSQIRETPMEGAPAVATGAETASDDNLPATEDMTLIPNPLIPSTLRENGAQKRTDVSVVEPPREGTHREGEASGEKK